MGGKGRLAPYIHQVMPPDPKHHLEPFGGSGAVLLGLPPSPSRLDIYNDFNSDLANLTLCVRDRPIALCRELKFLPIHSRVTFEYFRDFLDHKQLYFDNIMAELDVLEDPVCFTPEQAAELRPILEGRAELFDVKRAAAFFILCHGSFNATTTSFGVKPCNILRFLHLILDASRRLQNVVIENKDGIDLMKERDHPDGVTYCDPPYYEAENCYEKLFLRHEELHDVLTERVGYHIVSYNDCSYIRELYNDCYILAFKRDNPMAQKKNAEYGELIITNYDPRPFMTPQFTLFAPTGDVGRELTLVNDPGFSLREINLKKKGKAISWTI